MENSKLPVDRDKDIARLLKESWNLKRSHSRWAGGDHHVSVHFVRSPKKVAAHGYSTSEWSRNGKWRGTDSWVEIQATYRALKLFPMLTTPDGMHLVDAQWLGPRCYKIKWLENARGFELKIVDGWLVKGYHVKARSLEQARKQVDRLRSQAAEKLARQRAECRGTIDLYRRVWVTVEDSLAGGNCRPGTEQFVRNKLLPYLRSKWGQIGTIGAIRGDVLFYFAGENVNVRRALMAAVQRHRAMWASQASPQAEVICDYRSQADKPFLDQDDLLRIA